MFAICGATGKVGQATIARLRERGAHVRAILRDGAKASQFREAGCEVAIADLQDPDAMARAFTGADAVQVILPPPLAAEDAVGEMRRTVESVAAALDKAGPDRVLAVSDYGAHVEQWIGMPSAFRLFENRLGQLTSHKILLRSAEHMEGWGLVLPLALATGALPSFHHPVDAPFPTISARDLGAIATELLCAKDDGTADVRIVHAEGPRRYSANDVAAAVSEVSGRTVAAVEVPRSQWQETLTRVLSPSATTLLIDLYDAHNRGGLVDIDRGVGEVRHGTTELSDALRPLVATHAAAG
jgi:uncharacterized protein YbjT (DUF2867 family)